VLSSQAGASTVLGEFAVTVDIRKQESIVTGILQALTMSEAERASRMEQLRSIVMSNTTGEWLTRCLSDIVRPEPASAAELALLAKSGQARRAGGARRRAGIGRVEPVSATKTPGAVPASPSSAPPAH
jgi:trehalose-6-phosphate synthase